MSWAAVARKDFRDAIRSRAFWALSALFLLLVVGISVAYASVDALTRASPSALGLISFVASGIGTFVSVAAIVTCYRSIAGERESGSMKILLSLPHTRRDVIIGKVLGRTAVLAVPIVVALLAGAVVGAAALGDFAPVATVLFGVLGIVFALAYASTIVGLSATTGSTTRAAALAIAFLLVVELFWDIVLLVLVFVVNGFSFPATGFPDWLYPLGQLPPSNAFVTALSAVLPNAPGGGGGLGPGAGSIEGIFGTPWIALLVLAFWIVVPASLGYWRFQRADL